MLIAHTETRRQQQARRKVVSRSNDLRSKNGQRETPIRSEAQAESPKLPVRPFMPCFQRSQNLSPFFHSSSGLFKEALRSDVNPGLMNPCYFRTWFISNTAVRVRIP